LGEQILAYKWGNKLLAYKWGDQALAYKVGDQIIVPTSGGTRSLYLQVGNQT
jgi:hypothetical protein